MTDYVKDLAAMLGALHDGSYGNECVTGNGYRIGVEGDGKEICLWVEMPGDEAHWKVTMPADDAAILHMHLGMALRRISDPK